MREHPDFNNRDLIKEFFRQNPEYLAPETEDINYTIYLKVNQKIHHIAILGAGPSGLLAAYALALKGHEVSVYEKRSEQDFSLRWQNISINVPSLVKNGYPELYARLVDEKLLHFEMELENPGKIRSLRVSIGDLQDILASLCQQKRVKFHFNYKSPHLYPTEEDIVILASGAFTIDQYENQKIAERFEFESFPEHLTHGVSAISFEPSMELPEGFYKERLKSQDQSFNWGFKSIIVGAGTISQSKRLLRLNPTIAKFKMEAPNPALIWYLFGFDDPSKINLPFIESVDAVSYFDIIPSLARKGVILFNGKPLILWGDARVSSHPLTGAGMTIPFRSIKGFLDFIDSYDGDEASLDCYNHQTTPLALELFIKTILMTHF